jgi:AraC-like DNA-binding protein
VTVLERQIFKTFSGENHFHRPLTGRSWINAGYETVRPGKAYDWDGLRRGGQRRSPTWLYQYTLQGWGCLELPSRSEPVPAGSAFSVTIPSRHRYHSDPACEEWAFFWIIVRHPYAVERIAKNRQLHNRVISFAGNPTAPLTVTLDLVAALSSDLYNDPYRTEMLVLSLVYELERWTFASRHPARQQESVLAKCQNLMRGRTNRSLKAAELARDFGMSRTHFSHYFRKTVGDSPAAYLRKQKLKQAETLLTTSQLSVKEIAAKTGFTDANHLCKVFRAHFQCSPGSYRRTATSSLAAGASEE